MKSKLLIVHLILWIILVPGVTSSQINDSLQVICETIKVINDSSDPNYEYLSRSRSYKMHILYDTLSIEIESKDSLIRSEDPRDCRKYSNLYKMNIRDIGQINYFSKKNELYGYEWRESYIEFIALRYYPLFKNIVKNRTLDYEWIKIPVINHEDTVHFKKIVTLLKDFINIENNYIAPSCKSEEILLEKNTGKKITAIDVNNLEEPIKLNGNEDVEGELRRILIDYIEQENIKKFFGTVFIDQNDGLEYFYNEQNVMYNYLKTLDTIPAGYRVMRESAFFKITDEQKGYIAEILQKQQWTTGKCNGEKVSSYLDFYIDNNRYKEIGDK